jgi:hypothetical protein
MYRLQSDEGYFLTPKYIGNAFELFGFVEKSRKKGRQLIQLMRLNEFLHMGMWVCPTW